MTTSLDSIKEPISTAIDRFEGHFKQSIRSNVKLVDVVARYIVKQKGKRIRPIIVFLSAQACGGITEATYRGATLVEILHTATLVHDDVVDDADSRRGFASINAVWKNKIAVLMGDYLLATGMFLSLDHDDFGFLKIISSAVRRMSEAEILQIQKSRDLDIDEKTYLRIIADKTASLLSTCSEIGAASVTSDTGLRIALRSYGEHLGLAFQIRDDLLDYTGRRNIIGKPIGGDMKEKKITLPLIHALRQASTKDSRHIIKIIRGGAKTKDVEAIIRFVEEHGGIEYAVQRARHYSASALEALSALAESPAKKSLSELAHFVLERSK
jgi:octaprenyl-diphosphate synthase